VLVADRKLERVAGFAGFRRLITPWISWSGLAPDGSSLLTGDFGSQEVDALDCRRIEQAKRNNLLAAGVLLCDNYVMRSTRYVVGTEQDPRLGHYSDPPMLVLASLASGPKHGHAMIEDIRHLCGTRLGPGTLYGAIARLERQGWIEPLPAEERRRPYRITAEGVRVLRAKLATLRQFTQAGLERLESL
jgi:DNA-binding MarR family transcriptional regulator